MLALDTNVVVRYLTQDQPDQAAKAQSIIDHDHVFVATTVLLETEWVLRSSYDFDASQIVAALRSFAGLPNVTVEDPGRLDAALSHAAAGMDFADALHLAAASGCDALLSFDADFVRLARNTSVPVRSP